MRLFSKWIAIWVKIALHPSEQTILELSESPEAQSRIAYLWIFIVGVLFSASSAVAYEIPNSLRLPLITLLLLSIFSGGMLTLSFTASILIKQWIAKRLGGTGEDFKAAYIFAALYSPFAFLSSIFVLLGTIPAMQVFSGLIIGAAFLYNLALQIKTIKIVNNFGWKEAAISVMIPFAGILAVCSFAFIGFGVM
ncbi:MAG: hypothetical protein HYZ23_09230 [Chloroflexi bacterium]|nr:hypothetical protein [Chloroflexota bacterium]